MVQAHIFLLVFFVGSIGTVPLQSNGVRVRRDEESTESNSTIEFNGCTLDEIEYKAGQEVPSLGPCERCLCEAPDVVCSMIKCQPNSGCKIIQQSGQCCPEYKCDCEYNGRVYNNGERLDKPEDPCQVCYCKGGEIMCTSITCYERDDCQPHFSPGQCCPKYDHCPVEAKKVSGNSVRSVNASVYSPKREMQPWPLTKSSNTQSSISSDESNGSNNNVYPQTIKIVEILPTTPGYVNKPSEVSVIPRVKTNEEDIKEDYSKGLDHKTSEVITSSVVSSTEVFETSTFPSSSTSEIEHLLDTTAKPEEEEESEKQIIEAVPERTVSTANPLSEEISSDLKSSSTLPEAEPDSQNMATIYPNYYSTESNINNSEEGTTVEGTTEVEGSGYELLRGGLYEDFSSESQEYPSVENMTETVSMENYTTSNESKEETINESQDVPSYEAYTATGVYSNEELSSPLSKILEENGTNDTSVEIFDSNESSTEIKGNLQGTPESESDSSSSEESSSEENISLSTESGNGNVTENLENTSRYSTTYSPEYYHSTENDSSSYNYDASLVSSSENYYDEMTTISPAANLDVSSASSTEDNAGDSAANLINNNETVSSTADSFIQSTHSDDFSDINESTTDNGIVEPRQSSKNENKKMSRLAYRKLDTDSTETEAGSTLTFPSVLKVQSLGTDNMNTQTESTIPENTTSMARVGIYHPSKANELAGYLTIVDDKMNTSSSNDSTFSSHLILTPHDLKKLAEILIHEKIKPAHLEENKKTELSKNNFTNSDNFTEEENNIGDSSWNETSSDETTSNSSSTLEVVNEEIISSVVPSTESTLNEESSFENRMVNSDDKGSNAGSTASKSVILKENFSEDPNTSRQIRIPESTNHQYSSLLDDRDLLILENFFRKNIGLQ